MKGVLVCLLIHNIEPFTFKLRGFVINGIFPVTSVMLVLFKGVGYVVIMITFKCLNTVSTSKINIQKGSIYDKAVTDKNVVCI